MANSYTPPDRSTYDPGWNDPPPMPTMAGQTPAAAKPRLNLNKRVAFPMQSSAASSSTVKTTAEGLPLPFSTAKYQPPPMDSAAVPPLASSPAPAVLPPPPPTVFNPSASIPTNLTEQSAESFDSVEARQFCQSIFGRLVDAMAAKTEQSKLSEVRKRLESLEQMWQENKLNESAQKNLFQLAKALENNDTAAAMEQHRTLVTQHINVSTQWATALRQIILSISSNPETNPDAPAVLSETEIVQFVDVSSKPIVMDSVPSFLQEPTNVYTNPLPASTESNPPQTNTDNANANTSANNQEATNQSGTKSRFGRILHI